MCVTCELNRLTSSRLVVYLVGLSFPGGQQRQDATFKWEQIQFDKQFVLQLATWPRFLKINTHAVCLHLSSVQRNSSLRRVQGVETRLRDDIPCTVSRMFLHVKV